MTYSSLQDPTWYSVGNSKWFHLFLFVVHLTTAIIQYIRGVFSADGDICLYQVDWTLLDFSRLDSKNSTVVLDHVLTANVYYVDSSFEFFTAVSHFVYFVCILLVVDISFEVRMYEYSISASLMMFVIGTICGIRDFNYLMFLVGLIIMTMFLGRNHEVNWSKNLYIDVPVWKTPTVLGWFPFLWAWTFVIIQFYRVVGCSENNVPTSLHAVLWVLFLFYSFFGINQLVNLRGQYFIEKQLKYNAINNLFSLTSKMILSWIVYSGVASTGDTSCVT